jgi:hypothetical protein
MILHEGPAESVCPIDAPCKDAANDWKELLFLENSTSMVNIY